MYKHLVSIVLIIICTNFKLYAWNHAGHELISEIAFSQLSKAQQTKLDKILDSLINKLPPDEKKIYKSAPYQLSKLAKLSILPDFWKNRTLESIMYNLRVDEEKVDNNLISSKTYDWHYKSDLIPSIPEASIDTSKTNKKSGNNNIGRLDTVYPQLLIFTKKTDNLAAKALGIVFITHLLEDAHQPLHAMSNNLDNKNDKGGNRFCLQKISKFTEHCRYNLHSYWDSAAKTLNNRQIYKLQQTILTKYPKDKFSTKSQNLNVHTWLKESFDYWPQVYQTTRDVYPEQAYRDNVENIAYERIALAGYRLKEQLATLI